MPGQPVALARVFWNPPAIHPRESPAAAGSAAIIRQAQEISRFAEPTLLPVCCVSQQKNLASLCRSCGRCDFPVEDGGKLRMQFFSLYAPACPFNNLHAVQLSEADPVASPQAAVSAKSMEQDRVKHFSLRSALQARDLRRTFLDYFLTIVRQSPPLSSAIKLNTGAASSQKRGVHDFHSIVFCAAACRNCRS